MLSLISKLFQQFLFRRLNLFRIMIFILICIMRDRLMFLIIERIDWLCIDRIYCWLLFSMIGTILFLIVRVVFRWIFHWRVLWMFFGGDWRIVNLASILFIWLMMTSFIWTIIELTHNILMMLVSTENIGLVFIIKNISPTILLV